MPSFIPPLASSVHWHQNKTDLRTTTILVALGIICAAGALYANWSHRGPQSVVAFSLMSGVTLVAALVQRLFLRYSAKKEQNPPSASQSFTPPTTSQESAPSFSRTSYTEDPQIQEIPSLLPSSQHFLASSPESPPKPTPDRPEVSAVTESSFSSPEPEFITFTPAPRKLTQLPHPPKKTPPVDPSLTPLSFSLDITPVGDRSFIESSFEMSDSELEEVEFEQRDLEGNTRLHLTKGSQRMRRLLQLTHNKRLINTRNAFRQTPLHTTIQTGSPNSLPELLLANPDVNIQDIVGNAPLHLAVIEEKIDSVRDLFSANKKIDIDLKNYEGQTPLHLAAERGNRDIVLLLCMRKADANLPNTAGESALHIASRRGFVDVIETLVHFLDDLEIKNSQQATPLHVAVKTNQLEAAKTLIELGALLNCQDEDGNTPMHIAMKEDHLAMVLLLRFWGEFVKPKIDMNFLNNDGLEPAALQKNPSEQQWKKASELFKLLNLGVLTTLDESV